MFILHLHALLSGDNLMETRTYLMLSVISHPLSRIVELVLIRPVLLQPKVATYLTQTRVTLTHLMFVICGYDHVIKLEYIFFVLFVLGYCHRNVTA